MASLLAAGRRHAVLGRAWAAGRAALLRGRRSLGVGGAPDGAPSRPNDPEGFSRADFLQSVCLDLQQHDPDSYDFPRMQAATAAPDEGTSAPAAESADAARAAENAALVRLVHSLLSAAESSSSSSSSSDALLETHLSSLQDWASAGRQQLALGYLLYKDGQSALTDAYLTRLVGKLAANDRLERMSAAETVGLLLLVHFRRRRWQADEIYELIDPSLLQRKLAVGVDRGRMSSAEICAAYLGLKNIQGFAVQHPDLRLALYDRLVELAGPADAPPSSLDSMCVMYILLLLRQDNRMMRDRPEQLERVMCAFDEQGSTLAQLQLKTQVKIMSLGSIHNFYARGLAEKVLGRVAKKCRELSLRDMLDVCYFLRKADAAGLAHEAEAYEALKTELFNVSDDRCRLQDAVNLLTCLVYLLQAGQVPPERLEAVFELVNGLAPELYEDEGGGDGDDAGTARRLAEAAADALYRTFFPSSYADKSEGAEKEEGGDDDTYVLVPANLIKNLVVMDCTVELEHGDFHRRHGLRPDLARRLRLLHQARAGTPGRPDRDRPFLELERQLARKLGRGAGGYCKLLRPLPHYADPVLVFGHIAGNELRMPAGLAGAAAHEFKPAPQVGDWVALQPSANVQSYHCDRLKWRQMQRLGYRFVECPQVSRGNRKSNYQFDTIVEEILSGQYKFKTLA